MPRITIKWTYNIFPILFFQNLTRSSNICSGVLGYISSSKS